MATPFPTPTLTPTSVPTPSPSPSVLHVVVDGGSPVWLVPAMTGGFVLLAALITAGVAYLSLRASDRRKLKREDQRQWDSELKQSYVTIMDQTAKVFVELTLARSNPPEQLGEVTAAALERVRDQQLLLELIAPKAVHEVAVSIGGVLLEIFQAGFAAERGERPTPEWSADKIKRLDVLEKQLRLETRRALRMPLK